MAGGSRRDREYERERDDREEREGWERERKEREEREGNAGSAAAAVDFGLSGVLAAETNEVAGVVLKYAEPPEAALPTKKWRLYIFKGGEPLMYPDNNPAPPVMLARKSSFLFGREAAVADVRLDHPSCSKQHAVIQFRKREVGGLSGSPPREVVRPYLLDLGSTNKTQVNGEAIDPERYYELREKDCICFGNSSREYILLHEDSVG